MSEEILVKKSAKEWFREVVRESLCRRHMRIADATEFYLVDLLAARLEQNPLETTEPSGPPRDKPLALVLLEALRQDRAARFRELRRLGDTALYVSGFFGDSLASGALGIGYYIAMGERAYGALAHGEVGEDLFRELSVKFEAFVDLFAEIAELSDLRSDRGLVRLYERFLATRSERVAALLRERGLALPRGGGHLH